MRTQTRARMRLLAFAAAVTLSYCGAISVRAASDASNSSPRTLTSPKSFSGKSRSGVATSSTTRKSTRKRNSVARRTPLQKAPTPDRITEIQTALARAGYYQGDPTSKWDPDTVAAMQKFQSANGLDATGKLDALSLQKLGLGSAIAGVSAPTVPPSQHSSLTRGTSSLSSSSLRPVASASVAALSASGAATTASNTLPPQ